MKLTNIEENGLHLVFGETKEGQMKLLHFSALPFSQADLPHSVDPKTGETRLNAERFNALEIMVTGEDRPGERHGNKYISTCPGCRMRFSELRDERDALGRHVTLVQTDPPTGLETRTHYRFFDGFSAVRCWTEVQNNGAAPQGLEYVSSFALTGVGKEGLTDPDEKLRVWIPHNGWQREMQWERYTLPQLGFASCQDPKTRRSSKVIGATNIGNWSSKEYLPMGMLENTETGDALFFQIEHNGSWHWEFSDQMGSLYLQLSGPSETESHWWKNLAPGERFTTVPVCVGSVRGGFDEAMAELTKYRRAIRRKNDDNEKLCVIFNDYMNCLWGDPTAEKEMPLIDAAKKAGCEYFVIDAGWYADGAWWDNVGEWLPSKKRFPNGLAEVTDRIRENGMIPGVWLEIEVMGIVCPKAQRVPDDWFFLRHGKKVHDRSRWQLDFRNPAVVEHANEVIDRLVREYHVGYIKMDYNIEPGIGTDVNADSAGDGLLGHERAYLAWLDSVFARYPDLVIENCSSGGMRIDYAMLSRHSIQSTSDQEDYLRYATIAANAPSGLTPEQSAVWSYPMTGGGREEAVFNMVNALLQRIHQSGHLARIPESEFALVKEALDYYKTIRGDIRRALPFWPLGPSKFADTWISMGLSTEHRAYLAVWRRNAPEDTVSLPVKFLRGNGNVRARCAYPVQSEARCRWNAQTGTLSVTLPASISARIFELEF